MSLRVDTRISGSHCVVWKHREHYIDCRKGRVYNTPATNIECVRNGQVYKRLQVLDTEAPERIIELMRSEL